MVAKGSKKRERRTEQGYAQYEEALLKDAQNAVLASQPDSEIFSIDRAGSKNVRRRVEQEAAVAVTRNSKSGVEHKLIKKKVQALQRGEKTSHEKRLEAVKAIKDATNATYDTWGSAITVADAVSGPKDIAEEANPRRHALPAARATLHRSKNITKQIAHGGYSYNPSVEQHQDLLAEALALEIKKQEDLARKEGAFHNVDLKGIGTRRRLANVWGANAGTSTGTGGITTSANTGKGTGTITGEGQESDDEDGEDNEGNDMGFDSDSENSTVSTSEPRKLSRKQLALKSKKTQTQRNKEREKRAAAAEREKDQLLKKIVKGLNDVPKIIKAMQSAKDLATSKKMLRQQQKLAQIEENKHAISYKDAGLVPLNDELHGSLRTLIPKGNTASLVQDSFVNAGDAVAKDRRRMKRGEHPHKVKNIKWVAKHKYS